METTRGVRHLSRSPGQSALVLVAAVILLASLASAAAAQQQDGDVLRIPGGVARLLAVAKIRVPVEPARALPAIIRLTHNIRPPAHPHYPAVVYLDAVSRFVEAGRAAEAGQLQSPSPFFEACGLIVDRRAGVQVSSDQAVAERGRLLEQAGFPVEDWTRSMALLADSSVTPADRQRITKRLAEAIPDEDRVPALLPTKLWSSAVFGHDVTASLAASILGDRRAALLYYGLFALDDETLSYFQRFPELVSRVAESAGAFAAFSDGIVVRDGRVVLPGGPSAVPLWEALADAPATEPQRFLPALFSRDQGRLAWFFDTVAHLDAPHQAFALATFVTDAGARLSYVRALYDVFVKFERGRPTIAEQPFTRSLLDPTFILNEIRVSDNGRMSPPAGRAFWEAVSGGSSTVDVNSITSGQDDVTAAWIVNHVASQPSPTRRQYLDAVLFAQRLWVAASATNHPPTFESMVSAIAGFVARPALMVALEQIGLTDPADYAVAVANTDGLSRGDERRVARALAQFQGALTLLVRLHDVGTIGPAAAADLARALCENPGGDAVAWWLQNKLWPALPKPANGAQTAEERLIDALAGIGVERPRPTLEWEDHAYRVDVASGERARLRRIREKQADVDLTAVMDFYRSVSRLLDPAATDSPAERRALAQRATEALPDSDLLRGEAPLFGVVLPRLHDQAVAAIAQLGGASSGAAATPDLRRRLVETTDVLLADVLASFAYALAIGDSDASLLLAGNPARQHDFTLSMPSSAGWWRIAEEIQKGRVSVRGSLLGLDRVLGRDWLRPISFEMPEIGRHMSQEDMRGFGEGVTALNAFRLADGDRDAIAAALARGRERIRAARSVADLELLAEQTAVDGQRRRLMRWAAARDLSAALQYFSLVEVLRLGMPLASGKEFPGWGLPTRVLDGSLDVAMPQRLGWQQMAGRPSAMVMPACIADLELHVVEALAEMRLPAALTPGVLSFAGWDMVMSAAMTDGDDWLAVVLAAQSLPRDRISDYVSALTADGPLVPVDVK